MVKHPSRIATLLVALLIAFAAPGLAPVDAAPGRQLVPVAAARTERQAGSENYAVGVRNTTFVDTSRPTAANGTEPAKPSRTLPTTIFYPAVGVPGGPDIVNGEPVSSRRFPLIVFAHGFTANGPAYSLILRRLAAAGYVVAAPTFPLSSGGAPGGPNLGDYVNQPADVSFVIDEMLRLDRDRNSGLRHLIARQHIGVAGHSLGAITTIGLLNSCCIDRRVDAIVPISGIQLPFPGGAFAYQERLPTLLIHGDADTTVPVQGSRNVYASGRAPKFLLTLLGGGHVPFGPPYGDVFIRSMVDFFDAYLEHDRQALSSLFADGNIPGVATLTGVTR